MVKKVLTTAALIFVCIAIISPAWAIEMRPSATSRAVQKIPTGPITVQYCPPGWALTPNSNTATGNFWCKRQAQPSCAPGYHVKLGPCVQCNPLAGMTCTNDNADCAYQCIPDPPNFNPPCKPGYMKGVGACEVWCQEPPK